MLPALHAAMRALALSACLVFFVRCLCYQAQCVASSTAAAPATPAGTLGTHALVPLHLLQHSASCMSQSFLRLRTFRWHVCACVQILSGWGDQAQSTLRVRSWSLLFVCIGLFL